MERVYIFDCDRIIGDEEKRTIIENMEGKAEVIFDNSEGYDRDTDIVISTRCVGNRDVAGMEVIIREDIGVGCDYVGTAPYVIYEPEEIDYYYCQKVYARKKGLPAFILETGSATLSSNCLFNRSFKALSSSESLKLGVNCSSIALNSCVKDCFLKSTNG